MTQVTIFDPAVSQMLSRRGLPVEGRTIGIELRPSSQIYHAI